MQEKIWKISLDLDRMCQEFNTIAALLMSAATGRMRSQEMNHLVMGNDELQQGATKENLDSYAATRLDILLGEIKGMQDVATCNLSRVGWLMQNRNVIYPGHSLAKSCLGDMSRHLGYASHFTFLSNNLIGQIPDKTQDPRAEKIKLVDDKNKKLIEDEQTVLDKISGTDKEEEWCQQAMDLPEEYGPAPKQFAEISLSLAEGYVYLLKYNNLKMLQTASELYLAWRANERVIGHALKARMDVEKNHASRSASWHQTNKFSAEYYLEEAKKFSGPA